MTILSRHAYAIRDATDFPDTVCRLIGQFSATDIGYDPGDLFVRCCTWGTEALSIYSRSVMYENPPSALNYVHGFFDLWQARRVIGQEFVVYKVECVTACQVTATKLKSYHAYQRDDYMERGMYSCHREVNAAKTEMLFVEQHENQRLGEYRFRIKKSDEMDMFQFQLLDLSTAMPCTSSIRQGIINGVGRLFSEYDDKILFIKET